MKYLLPLIVALSTLLTFCVPAPTPTPAPTATLIPTATAISTSSPTAAPTPTRAQTEIPTATAIPTFNPTAAPTPTRIQTEIPTGSPTLTTTSPTQNPNQTTTATRQANNYPTSCDIPGTQQIGIGFFDLQSRIVTFCIPDIAAVDACEPRNLEFCHCNSTSGCCQRPGVGDLSIGDQTVTLHYPAGTTSFQAAMPPACRTHGSDRVLIIGFPNPLP